MGATGYDMAGGMASPLHMRWGPRPECRPARYLAPMWMSAAVEIPGHRIRQSAKGVLARDRDVAGGTWRRIPACPES